jgi:hypothetical protein
VSDADDDPGRLAGVRAGRYGSGVPPAETDSKPAEKGFPQWYHWICGGTAIALVVWGSYMLLWGHVPKVCHDELANIDNTAPKDLVVQVCEPMSATDPRVFLFLIALLLLLVPFFSEIEIPGILRVKRDIRQAEQDLETLRTSIGIAQTQISHLTSSASATSNTEVNVYPDRARESGKGLTDYESADEIVEPTRGAYAQAAFNAAVLGLPQMLSGWAEDASLVGFTIKEDGTYSDPQVHYGDVGDEAAAQAHMLLSEHPTGAKLTRTVTGVVVTSPARDDDGAIVGGLAVIVERPGSSRFPGTMSDITSTLADVQAIARTYARLLIDLLGETGRMLTEEPREEDGQ